MAGRLRRGFTFANVCSFLALTIALGTGGAYAANTVFSTDIVNGQVKNDDLAASAVTSAKIYNGSVLNADLGLNSVTSDRVATNSLIGADINESTLAGVKLGGLDTVHANSANDSLSYKTAQAYCPDGTKVVGTGYDVTGAKAGGVGTYTSNVVVDQVTNYGTSVYVMAFEIAPTADDWSIIAEATCANAE